MSWDSFLKYQSDGSDEKLRYNHNLTKDSIVFDVGGYTADWTVPMYCKFGCKIYIFEPVSKFYKLIKSKFEFNPDIKVFKSGLSNIDKIVEIGVSNDASSTAKEFEEKESIQLVDIAKFIQENNISRIDLLKLNIEGGEYDVLDRLIETGLINIVHKLQIQFHDWYENAIERRDKIEDYLKENYKEIYNYEFIWEEWEK